MFQNEYFLKWKMKSLQVIQKLAKVGKVLSIIVFICCLVGTCGCAVSLRCGTERGNNEKSYENRNRATDYYRI